ncbi:hypothetical protein [Methanobacterium sp.]|uniref:hypothetical protein n=1 Tax=Methanobacterium sp. TaxID=2164 RepID=UPI002ABC1496|nr:hypothetical protein [Methanobacterium sp.]MDY9922791.1 hypothetical protein [Methanobacterium sp.]
MIENPMPETTIRLFEFDEVHSAVVDCVKTFIDVKTIPDPEDPDAPPATVLFEDVHKTRPAQVSLFEQTMGVARFDSASIKKSAMGGGLIAEVSGGVEIWIAGRGDEPETLCKRYTDIVRGYLKNKDIIDFPGVIIKPVKPGNDDPKWANVNLTDPRKSKLPVFYTLGYVEYRVMILKRKEYVIPGG